VLNCVAIGEIKKRDGENFSGAHIGQAISFGEKSLQLQPRRKFAYVLLTDCIVINIYKASSDWTERVVMPLARILAGKTAIDGTGENILFGT
jgi:hypothetical protein